MTADCLADQRNKKAAYFLLTSEYLGRPLDEGVIRALLALDYQVDLFAPGLTPAATQLFPGAFVTLFPCEYRLQWLINQLLRREWHHYELFLGTSDLPMAIAGALSKRFGGRCIAVCDEIFLGGYEGNARKGYWKYLVRRGMQQAAMTIITDLCRVDLQQRYAGLGPKHRFLEYPCCYCETDFQHTRKYWKDYLGLRSDNLTLSFSGHTSTSTGAHWVINSLDRLPPQIRILFQPGGSGADPFMSAVLRHLSNLDDRVLFIPGRNSSFVEAMSLNLASDIGLVFYLSPKPQFQRMGLSSNKLCMYLKMARPVIASRQPSFDFLEEHKAGVLIESEEEIPDAVEQIASSYAAYSLGAEDCFHKFIRPRERLESLSSAILDLSRR